MDEHLTIEEREATKNDVITKLYMLYPDLIETPEFRYLQIAMDIYVSTGREFNKEIKIGKDYTYIPQSTNARRAYEELYGRILYIYLTNNKKHKSVVVIRNPL